MNYNTILPPFKWFVLQNFPYIEDDFDALTNWQLFCKLGKEMNKIIEKCNLTGEQVENLTNAYNELKAYIDNYFENLDVQEEINNKLDEMAEQGVLTDIIAQYLQLAGVLSYDTKADMKAAENLADGSTCYILGESNYNDGKGSYYKVRTITNEDKIDNDNIVALDVSESLIAEKIKDNTDVKVNSNIQLTLLGRKLAKNGITNQIDYDADTHYYTMSQGGCAINENLYAVCYIETNEALKDDNMAKLEIIDLRDGTVQDSVTFEGGHCNKVFYVPETEKLYTVDCYYLDSEVISLTSNIHEFNVNDLSEYTLIEPTITDDNGNAMNHFEYDKVTGKYYAGSLIDSDNTIQVNEIDFETFETKRKFYIEDYKMYNNATSGVIFQNFVINNNRIYVNITGSQLIKIYDMSGNLVEILNLPKNIDSIYRLSELEGFSIYNDRFYCNAWDNINNLRNSINTFFTFSLDENSPKTENEYFSSTLNIYVDKQANVWNPRGSEDLPFNEIYEIQNYLTREELQQTSVTIILKENETVDSYDRFGILPNVNVIIECNNNKISCAVIGKVSLFKPKIYKSNPNDYPLHIQQNGEVKMFEATFEEEFTDNIIISNSGRLVYAGNNQYVLTDKSKKLIDMAFGGELITDLDISQLYFRSANTFLNNNKYKINKNEINSNVIGDYDYNDFMTNNNLNVMSTEFNRFPKIMVEYSFMDSGLRCYKTVNKRDYINISDTNMSDGNTTYLNIYEMTIQFTTTKIKLLHNKSYDVLNKTWDSTTQLMKLQNIWLA